jgi:hypothetical protein
MHVKSVINNFMSKVWLPMGVLIALLSGKMPNENEIPCNDFDLNDCITAIRNTFLDDTDIDSTTIGEIVNWKSSDDSTIEIGHCLMPTTDNYTGSSWSYRCGLVDDIIKTAAILPVTAVKNPMCRDFDLDHIPQLLMESQYSTADKVKRSLKVLDLFTRTTPEYRHPDETPWTGSASAYV